MATRRTAVEKAENGYLITVTSEKKNAKGFTDYIEKKYVAITAIEAEKIMQEQMKIEKDK